MAPTRCSISSGGKSRGSVEKFHGAVVDHVGHIDTRIGREVCQLGEIPQ
ncbi:beta-galactosidase [Escherichia coli]